MAANPDSPDSIGYVDCPDAVRSFIQKNDATLLPHVVFGETETYVFYYKDANDLAAHVTFEDSKKMQHLTKSLNGAKVSQWDNGNATGGYISQFNTTYAAYQPIYGINAIHAYGITNPNVGSAMNDRISLVQFYMYNGDEPVTYVANEDVYGWGGDHQVVITKMKASGSNGSWVASNQIGLWGVRMTWLRNWNDKISAYQFFQSPITLNVGITIR